MKAKNKPANNRKNKGPQIGGFFTALKKHFTNAIKFPNLVFINLKGTRPMMTKQQTKALEIAAGHLNVGNPDAFLQSVSRLIRCATNQKQIDAIKVAAFDLQFGGQ